MCRHACCRTELPMGTRLACLMAGNNGAGWMAPGKGWFPPPRAVHPALATACWETTRCDWCGDTIATLRTLRPHVAGSEITVPAPLCKTLRETFWPWEITFDGGAKSAGEYHTAGAGATLWDMHTGPSPICVARAYVALPPDTTAQVAEAHGCRIGVRLLLGWATEKRARIVGDNLGVIRYGAGTQRFRALRMQGIMEDTVTQVARAGLRLDWQAVRRRLNTAADALATAAQDWCKAIQQQGLSLPREFIEWRDTPSSPPFRPPPWPIAD